MSRWHRASPRWHRPTAVAGVAYAYDADDTVEASGTAPITFALTSGPPGMTVSGTGLVTWTPTAAQEGSHPVEIDAVNAVDTDSRTYREPHPYCCRMTSDGDFAGWSVVDEGTEPVIVVVGEQWNHGGDNISVFRSGAAWRNSARMRSTTRSWTGYGGLSVPPIMTYWVSCSAGVERLLPIRVDQQRPPSGEERGRGVQWHGGLGDLRSPGRPTRITAQGTSIEVRVDGGLVFS